MTSALKRALFWFIRPLWRLLIRALPAGDPWERLDYQVPLRHYGLGARMDFEWYFQGECAVSPTSLEAIQDWLLGCTYAHDKDLFEESDFWQHPRTFERLRAGDCEDHALWAWRQLVNLGFDAELVSGRCLPWTPRAGAPDRGHVWVVFRAAGETYLFETVAKDRSRMIRPLGETLAEYRPEYGVDARRRRFAYAGALVTMKEWEFRTSS